MDVEGAEIAEHDGRGCKTEGDIVSQRVEFLTNVRGYVKQTGTHAVEEVEDGSDDNEQQRHPIVALESKPRGDAARNQITTRNGIGNMLLHNS